MSTTPPQTDPPAPAPLLITGMSRSGTTWLTRIMNLHPDVAAFGESLYWGRSYVEPEADGLYRAPALETLRKRWQTYRIGPQTNVAGGLACAAKPELREAFERLFNDALEGPGIEPATLFRQLCAAIAELEGKPRWAEKTPHHCLCIDRMLDAMSDARVVFMYRDPYTFMLSYKHQGDRRSPDARRQFRRLYHPIGCALVWRGYARAALREIKQGHAHMVRFDDLRQSEADTLRGILEFWGLSKQDLAEKLPRDNTSFVGERPELSPADIFWINRLAGKEIDALGFERRRAGIFGTGLVKVLGSFFTAPLWGLRTFFTMRRSTAGSTFSYLKRWLRSA